MGLIKNSTAKRKIKRQHKIRNDKLEREFNFENNKRNIEITGKN